MEYIKPDSIKINSLIKRVKLGDEDAQDELWDIIDEIAKTNIELIDKLNKIMGICAKNTHK